MGFQCSMMTLRQTLRRHLKTGRAFMAFLFAGMAMLAFFLLNGDGTSGMSVGWLTAAAFCGQMALYTRYPRMRFSHALMGVNVFLFAVLVMMAFEVFTWPWLGGILLASLCFPIWAGIAWRHWTQHRDRAST